MRRPTFGLSHLALASFLATAALVPTTAAAQSADERAQARTEFERGRSAFEAGAFTEALEHFQEAYRIAPHPSVRVNIANCYDRLERPLEALFHFEHFLAEAERPPAAQRREVEASIRRLQARVGTIALQVTPDGAQITIDQSEQRRAPVAEPVRVVAGSHTVEIRLDGFVTERQTVEVQGGGSARVAVRLRRPEVATAPTTSATTATAPTATTTTTTAATTTAAATTTTAPTTAAPTTTATTTAATPAAAASEPAVVAAREPAIEVEREPAPAASSGGGLRITEPVVIGASITGVAIVTAAIFGPLSLASNGSFEDAVARSNDPSLTDAEREQARQDGLSSASQARTFAAVTDVALIGGVVAAGATTVFFVLAQNEDEQDTASAWVLPVVSPTTVGVTAAGRF